MSVKHNSYILEDKVYLIMNKDIAFQAINIYPRKHDIMCIYIRNILCIYGDCKLEEREPTAMHHQRRRGHR
jgi:hypothetical protein